MKKRAPTKVLIGIVERVYRSKYLSTHGEQSALRLSGRQRTRLKELLQIFGLSEIRRRIGRYFDDRSRWLVERHHPWNVFVSGIDQYGGRHGKKEGRQEYPEERTDWIKKDIEAYKQGKGG